MSIGSTGLLKLAVSHGPTAFILIMLGGLGYYGHQTGWKIPEFTEFFSQSSETEEEDWCETHNVPESVCLACQPELAGANPRDWCREHGVPESKCTVCNPEILTTGQADDWCSEHEIPESQCTLCNPDIAVTGDLPASEDSPTALPDPGASPTRNPFTCQTHLSRVQFASSESVQKTGIELEAVQERPIAAYINANAEIGYDQTRIARLSSKASGTVWRVEREVGERVKKGDVLAFIDAAEVGRVKSELLQAFAMVDVRDKTLNRIQTSAKEGYRTQAELLEAEGALREARIRLFNVQQNLINLGLPINLDDLSGVSADKLAERVRLLGLPDQSVQVLDSNTATANLIAVIAPLDGIVVSREIVDGEVIDTSKTLFVVADVSRMWVMLDIRLEDAGSLIKGQQVIFRTDRGGDEIAPGQISWISTAVNEKTRTVKARADIDNPEGHWRAGTFGTARVTIRENPNANAVNNEAIHWEGCCHVVFVRQSDTVFQTRKVKIGARSGDYTEILIGLLPDEVVATTGSHVLKSEILKSRLGAGCVDD